MLEKERRDDARRRQTTPDYARRRQTDDARRRRADVGRTFQVFVVFFFGQPNIVLTYLPLLTTTALTTLTQNLVTTHLPTYLPTYPPTYLLEAIIPYLLFMMDLPTTPGSPLPNKCSQSSSLCCSPWYCSPPIKFPMLFSLVLICPNVVLLGISLSQCCSPCCSPWYVFVPMLFHMLFSMVRYLS